MNKGYTLIEVLLVIIIMSYFAKLTFNNDFVKSLNKKTKVLIVENEILNTKISSLANINVNCVSSNLFISNKQICFNENGNVNMAQTVQITNNSKKIVIHLGAGIYEIK